MPCDCGKSFVGGHAPRCSLFTCAVCGGPTVIAPEEGPAYCYEHCPDHDYHYERSEGWRCLECHAEPPPDWFDFDDVQ
jgi:hypothetical protein